MVVQTPEIVKLKLLGGASLTVKTADYLAKSPTNLSSGFRLWVTFGLDYAHQDIITGEIPALLAEAIHSGLTDEGQGDNIHSIRVQFQEAGASSLNVAVLADFKGTAGSEYNQYQRTIQRICVDTCNRHDWVIPFQQVTVHMAEPKGNQE